MNLVVVDVETVVVAVDSDVVPENLLVEAVDLVVVAVISVVEAVDSELVPVK